ncbi:phosphatidate cytidylyltransferase [Sphingorhabdus sp. 109]|jgi:phosphatidate cytidylyltransferase|uniref:phosphatidate cytidylyltransferase n=1 Tax=Sphingorhabdus sp. 109 TaxID=2653173 RepID=UPI0012F26DBB|nr:phosphatidate cytidylyltransferase [Sphingorhabdus sp. 109]VWX56519.1 Phosphatidate cytidylyltransferase [Sphingorhabdus sp. 109]
MNDPAVPVPGKANELQTRIIVGILLIGVALLAGYFGGMLLWLLAVLMSLGIMSEWAGLTGRRDKRLLAMYALSVPLAIMSPWAAGPSFLALGLILGAAMFVAVFDRSIKLAAGVVYAGLPALAVLYLREIDKGILVMLWTLALVWATDIGAYFSGRAIGGPKLAPQYSPNKTWAGLVGGVILTAALSFALHVHWGLSFYMVLLSIPLAVLAQMGDLFESWLKRKAGAKDSGTIFPGHGGVMDRLDGLIPVAPVVALIMLVDSWSTLS